METLHDPPSAPYPAGTTAHPAHRLDSGPAPMLRLRLEDGREIPIDRTLQLGSGLHNDVVLDDPFVSGIHCALSRTGDRTMIKDLGSRNGTWLGPVRVRLCEVPAGARLTLGGTTLQVVGGNVHDGGMIGQSAAVRDLRRELRRAAPTSLSVLLLGESGTGKELAARALHAQSGRTGPLVTVNCGALSPELAESELFGHERGAFTGAAGRKEGLFAEAEGGTLFFDEIGELPLALQPKLLRALESRCVRAVGGHGERKVDVRVIAATHRDLPAAILEHAFRLDLYHRLSAIEIRLPSLRERPDDIPLLAAHFLDDSGEGGPARSFTPEALTALSRHPWPGNIRELKNAVSRAAHLGARLITPADLFPRRAAPPAPTVPASFALAFLSENPRLDDLERQVVERALRQHGGKVRPAARALGVAPSTLYDRVRRWKRADAG